MLFIPALLVPLKNTPPPSSRAELLVMTRLLKRASALLPKIPAPSSLFVPPLLA